MEPEKLMISHLGRYEIIEELGRGAMGVVYKAHDPLIERFVAIKSINLDKLTKKEKEEFEARFFQEAKAAGTLNHPNIVTIHDLGESGDIAYIAMELMTGRELQNIMNSVKRLSIDEVLNIAIQVASGLFYAHQHGIVHRDVKPSNIMVLGNNHVKIADFGIAKISSSLTLTKINLIMGSPLYMSPEQIMSEQIEGSSDIFSLGIVLYQMLTGQLPFIGENVNSVMYQIVNEPPQKPSLLNPEITDALDAIVLKCLAKKPGDRYKNANELAEDLRSYRDKLLRAKDDLGLPLAGNTHFKLLKRLATPGAVPQNFVIIGSYLVIATIFMVDVITPSTIQLHMFYLFPLVMMGFHCEQMRLVNIAIISSLLLQGTILAFYSANVPILPKLALATIILLTNIMIAYVARVARANFLDVAKLASFDGLTGLRNRLSFESIVGMEMVKQTSNNGAFSFALIDFDNFKELNESKGHQAGDKALKLLANVLLENIRQPDTVARIGGDEFAILMPNTDANDCELLCKQLSEKISGRMEEAAFPVSTSIGYVTFKQAPASISEIFHKAENAMLAAQASGKKYAISG